MSRIWLVEMWNEHKRRWEPTVGAALTKDECKTEMALWRHRVGGARFRLQKYTSASAGTGSGSEEVEK